MGWEGRKTCDLLGWLTADLIHLQANEENPALSCDVWKFPLLHLGCFLKQS